MPYLDKKYNYGRKSRSHNLREAGLFVGFSMLAIMLTLFVMGWISYAFEAQAASGINKELHYQGKLNDSSGVAVSDDTYNIKFVIYDASAGGNCLWTSVGACDTSDFGTTTITTVNGVFSVDLGNSSHNSLATSSIDWNTDSLYLGVSIRGTTASPTYDAEMTPRKQIISVAYAFNSDMLNGFSATSTIAASSTIPVFDKDLTLNLFTGGVSSTKATTTSLYVGANATVTANLNVGGYVSTTNIILSNEGSNLGTYFDLYVSGGNLFFNGTQVGSDANGNSTITGHLNIGGINGKSELMRSGDLFVGGSATVTETLEITGYVSTTNLVLADGGSDLGTYNDLYVSDGNLFFNDTQLGAAAGASFWQYNAGLEKTLTTTSTDIGIYITASSTIAANFRVDGNVTTTGNFTVGTSTFVIKHDPTGTKNDRVGIGTSNPFYRLEVAGNLDTVTSSAFFSVDQMQLAQLEGGIYFGAINIAERQWNLGDYGSSWIEIPNPSNGYSQIAMNSDGSIISALDWDGEIYQSTDYGKTWIEIFDITEPCVNDIAMNDNGKIQAVVTVCGSGVIFISLDYGVTWDAKAELNSWDSIGMSGDGRIMTVVENLGGVIAISKDYGDTWTEVVDTDARFMDVEMSNNGRIQTAIDSNGEIYRSTDYGENWTVVLDVAKSSVLDGLAMSSNGRIQTIVRGDAKIIVSYDYGLTWATTTDTGQEDFVDVDMSADGRIQTAVEQDNGTGKIFTSDDYGATWTERSNTSDGFWGIAMSSDGRIQVASDLDGKIYVAYATVQNNGKVGINTSTPSWQFQVGNVASSTYYSVDSLGNSTTSGHLVIGTSSPGDLVGAGDLFVGNSATITANLVVQGDYASTTGYVVIGTGVDTLSLTAGDLFIGNNATITRNLMIPNIETVTGTAVHIDAEGLITKDSSSLRYKTDVDYNGIDGNIVYDLQPASFIEKATGREYIGFIAEDVIEVEPRLVVLDKEGKPDALHYGKFTALLTQAIQDQKIIIDQIINNQIASSNELIVVENPDVDINSLVVQQAATFYGTIYVQGEAGFSSKVVFEEEVEFQDHITVTMDTAGTMIIDAGATTTDVVFATEYEAIPKITASLNTLVDVNYAITEKTTSGFRLSVLEPVDQDVSFDWIALAVKTDSPEEEPKETTEPPSIDDFITSLDSVGINIPVELWVQVTDADTELSELTYSWTINPDLGEIDGDSGLVYWTVPEAGGLEGSTEVTITVTVSDGINEVSDSRIVTLIIPTEKPPTVVLGCTDATALNFSPDATDDDGLCEYTEEEIVVEPEATTTEEIVVEPDPDTEPEATTTEEIVVEDGGTLQTSSE